MKERTKQRPRAPVVERRSASAHAGALPLGAKHARSIFFDKNGTLVSFTLAAATALVYAAVWQCQFVTWDDPNYITQNRWVRAGLSWQNIIWAFTTGHAPYWHPLTWLSHMADVSLFGLNPAGHHLSSLSIHIVNSVLLFWLLRYATGAFWRSALAASLFSLHPLRVESVAWVAERKDVLSGLFWLLSLWFYIAYARTGQRSKYLGSLALYACALMAKPMAVTLPVVLLLADFWPLQRIPWSRLGERKMAVALLREKVPFGALAAVCSVITVMLQQYAMASVQALPIGLRIENAFVSYSTYLIKTAWPANLSALYPLPNSIPLLSIAGSILFLVLVSWGGIRAAERRPYILFGWLWYLVTLVPVIGVVQVGNQAMADRFVYIPLIGIFVIIAWALPDSLASTRAGRTAVGIAIGLVLVGCGWAAHQQVQYWKTSTALWTHTINTTGNNYLARKHLADLLWEQGKSGEAAAQYREAIRINPNVAEAHVGLGAALLELGNREEATSQYREALKLDPQSWQAYNQLGILLAQAGKPDEAAAQYVEALHINPEVPELHNNLGALFADKGETDQAIDEFQKSLNLLPDADVYYNLANMYLRKGNAAAARLNFERALAINPDHLPSRQGLRAMNQLPH